MMKIGEEGKMRREKGKRKEGEGGGETSTLNSHLNELIRNNQAAAESRQMVEETHKAKVGCFDRIINLSPA